jgi:hypothetical protein
MTMRPMLHKFFRLHALQVCLKGVESTFQADQVEIWRFSKTSYILLHSEITDICKLNVQKNDQELLSDTEEDMHRAFACIYCAQHHRTV